MIQSYLQEIFSKFHTGDAAERTYYSSLENFFKQLSSKIGDYSILIEGKNSPVRIPDFKIKDTKDLLIGYVEAKDLGTRTTSVHLISSLFLLRYLSRN